MNHVNNARIAKNAILLYTRMLIIMLVSLYTSRVILGALGVVDYGLYNVIGGVVVMFTFLNGSMASSTQRFLNYGLGQDQPNSVKAVFSSSVIIHIMISIIILILAETIGLWFVYNKLVIPPDRFVIALWVYQISIISCVVMVTSTPYHAAIIAYERMDFYAYISIVECVFKLLIAYLISICKFDRLLLYTLFLFFVLLCLNIVKVRFCHRHFGMTKILWKIDRQQMKRMFGFSVWNMLGGLALIGVTQGVNMLLNMFYGPALNAARAIGVQVQTAVGGISRNFQTAANPQIIQSFAAGDLQGLHKLLIKTSKFSFFLLYLISLPVILEIDYILQLWLVDVPQFSVEFIRILLLITLLDTTVSPLVTAVNATGILREYQLTVGLIVLSVVPISYVVLRCFDVSPYVVFLIVLLTDLLAQAGRLYFCRKQAKLDIWKYVKSVYGRIMLVFLLSVPIPWFAHLQLEYGMFRLFVVVAVSLFFSVLAIYICGMTNGEKSSATKYVSHLIKSKI